MLSDAVAQIIQERDAELAAALLQALIHLQRLVEKLLHGVAIGSDPSPALRVAEARPTRSAGI
jgi:hypothetical protein